MRRIIGPILTTGVALVAASVVIANPIVVPRADVQVPAFTLSAGNDETGGMLDPAFLAAIAPAPSTSDNPLSMLKQLITSLATDATAVGRDAIVDAFVAGVAAVSQPELTAASFPYAAPAGAFPGLTEALLPGFDISAAPSIPVSLADAHAFVTDAVAPAVTGIVAGLAEDAGYVGSGLIAAAFAAGTVVANEPQLIADTLVALVNGDLDGALQTAVRAVIAPIGPPVMIFDTIRTVIENRLMKTFSVIPALPAQSVATVPTTLPGDAVDTPTPTAREKSHRRNGIPDVSLTATGTVSGPAAALRVSAARSASAVGTSSRKTVDVARDAITAIGEKAGAVVADAAGTVGNLAGRTGAARAAASGHRG